jgi:hypothetical protein
MVRYSLPHVSSRSRHHVVRPTTCPMRTPPHSFISSSHPPYGSFFFIIIAQSIDTASYVFKGLISLCTFASLDIELDSPCISFSRLFPFLVNLLLRQSTPIRTRPHGPEAKLPGLTSKQTYILTNGHRRPPSRPRFQVCPWHHRHCLSSLTLACYHPPQGPHC